MPDHNSRLIRYLIILLILLLTGCNRVFPVPVKSFLPMETTGSPPTRQTSPSLMPSETPHQDQAQPFTFPSSAIPTDQPVDHATFSVAADSSTPAFPTHSWVIAAEPFVYLRSCPSVTCAVVGEISAGQKVPAVGKVSDGSWIQVSYQDSHFGKAWVYGKLARLQGDPLPIVMESTPPSPSPLLPAMAPQACMPIGPINMLLGYLPEHPSELIGGGYLQSGDFIFEIWLGCDSLFGPNAEYTNQYSDIPGLGLHLVLSYRGGTEAGEIVEAWGVREPGMRLEIGNESSSSGNISSSVATHLAGLRIPSELLPKLSQPGNLPLEFVYQARNPEGKWTGAVLAFTLVNKLDSIHVSEIEIHPLSEQDLR